VEFRLILVKNPWSTEAFNGPCNDNDKDFWTSRMVQELNNHIL
jgi:hypothetical protein